MIQYKMTLYGYSVEVYMVTRRYGKMLLIKQMLDVYEC